MNEIKVESFEEYLKRPEMSSSKVRDILKSPAVYQYNIKFPRKVTPALKLGTMIHAAVLEPEKFNQSYVVLPTPDFKTKSGEPAKNPWATTEGKKFYEGFVAANPGKEIIDAEEMSVVDGVYNSLKQHQLISNLLKEGIAERSFYFTDPGSGIACKARPDFLRDDGIIVDIKSTRDASFEAFRHSVKKYGYHIQAAFYMHALEQFYPKKMTDYLWLAVETHAPYHCALYRANQMSMEIGESEFKRGLDLFKKCESAGVYPGLQWDWNAGNYAIEDMDLPPSATYLAVE